MEGRDQQNGHLSGAMRRKTLIATGSGTEVDERSGCGKHPPTSGNSRYKFYGSKWGTKL